MKPISFSILLAVAIALGCVQSSYAASSPAPRPGSGESAVASSPERIGPLPAEAPAPAGTAAKPDDLSADYGESADYVEEEGRGKAKAGIADPLEPFNRAMYHFNDKLYFWVLKPVAQGYKAVVPEVARIGVNNFFTNIAFPIRFVNCLLQANFKGAGTEIGRFVLNTLGGIGGILDPASREDVGLPLQDEDFGQTLGVYGAGQGFYIVWPVLGSSSPRDTLGTVGDYFTHPFFSYDGPWLITWELRAFDKVNDTSLRIGDYESLKEAAIDPYVAIRDAYVQYRASKIKEKGGHLSSSKVIEKPPAP